MQELVMEADYDDFKIIQEYLDAVPRSNEYELKAMGSNLVQRGQQTPIVVRADMGILDGYTRADLLGQRGVKIKYIFKHFDTIEEEKMFVKETNVMRRQLNAFQRLEVMYEMYREEREARKVKDFTSRYDIMYAIKDNFTTSNAIAKRTQYDVRTVNRLLLEMIDSYYVSRSLPDITKAQGCINKYQYKVLPKGEEQLANKRVKKTGSVDIMIGKITGLSRNTVNWGMFIIGSDDEEIKTQLRNNKIGIEGAYSLVQGRPNVKHKPHLVWGKTTKIQCPSCKEIHTKEEYVKVG